MSEIAKFPESTSVEAKIERGGVIPVVGLETAALAVPLCRALTEGGLPVLEITFRTEAAVEAMRLVAREFPEFVLGAGTVTKLDQVEAAKAAGAQFAVAPGFDPKIARRAAEVGLPFFPGVCTPTEIGNAMEHGCRTLKFFPSEAMGGLKTIRAIVAPIKHFGIRLIPTGGIDAANAPAYLAEPTVLAVGGSWIAPAKLIREERWGEITRLAREAASLRQRTT